MSIRRFTCGALLAALLAGPATPAQDNGGASSPERIELKERFEARYPDLRRLKTEGQVGETWEGFIAPVDDVWGRLQQVRRLVDDENRDRRRLYQLLTDEVRADLDDPERDRITPEKVARRNARRNFENARRGEYLQIAEALWVRKDLLDAALRLQPLKDEGVVGETWNGRVGMVEGAATSEARGLVDRMNEFRAGLYERIAKARERSTEEVAREYGERLVKAAPRGQFVQGENGTWRRK